MPCRLGGDEFALLMRSPAKNLRATDRGRERAALSPGSGRPEVTDIGGKRMRGRRGLGRLVQRRGFRMYQLKGRSGDGW